MTAEDERTCDRCDRVAGVVHPMIIASQTPDAAALITFDLCGNCQVAEGGHAPHAPSAGGAQ
jgi:hypothetical protein